jgi:hypothetical protein
MEYFYDFSMLMTKFFYTRPPLKWPMAQQAILQQLVKLQLSLCIGQQFVHSLYST